MIPHAPSLHPGAGNRFDFAVEISDVLAHAKNIAQATVGHAIDITITGDQVCQNSPSVSF